MTLSQRVRFQPVYSGNEMVACARKSTSYCVKLVKNLTFFSMKSLTALVKPSDIYVNNLLSSCALIGAGLIIKIAAVPGA